MYESTLALLRSRYAWGYVAGNLRTTVKDDGVGFEVDDSRRTEDRHLGLAGMEEPARMLGGRLTNPHHSSNTGQIDL